MLALRSLLVGAGSIIQLPSKHQPHRRPTLIQCLCSEPTLPPMPAQAKLANLLTAFKTSAAALNTRYQAWMQANIDPLLGQHRYQQLQTLGNKESLALTPDERYANQQLAFGGIVLSVALLGGQTLPIAGLVAVLGLGQAYAFAYHEWHKKRRVGAIHLLLIFLTFLFLSGYAAIGAFAFILTGLGLKVKAISEKESRSNLINVFKLQPQTVWVRTNGIEIEIPFPQLKVGDTLVLQAGQVVPVDGAILTGVALVDQRMLTGEAQPVEKNVGDPVLAATLVVSGKIDVSVEKTGKDTTAGQIGEILNRTAQSQLALNSTIMERVDRLALPTLAASAVSLPLLGPAGAASLLGANFTTATFVSAPLTLLNFLNKAAHQGILIKEIVGLERLSQIDTVVFDKTGTLTLDQPHVARIYPLHELSEAAILTLAAAAEARQTHPIARAILVAAEERQLALPAIDQVHYEVGYGLKVWLRPNNNGEPSLSDEGQTLVRVGSVRFMTMEEIALPSGVDALSATCQAQGHSLVLVAVAEQVVGALELQPTVRPEAQRIVEELRRRGLALYIISGDQETPTRTLAQALGMNGYFANTLPGGKAQLVEQLQQAGRQVCFIGDGINDALAMRQAHVSISLRGATTVATDTAQMILMDGNLNQLVVLFELAQRFTRNLQLNFRTTATTSIVAVAGIFFAHFSFVAIEVLYSLSLLTCIGIAVKPLLDKRTEEAVERSPV